MRKYSINCGVSVPRGANKHMTLLYLGEQDEEKMNSLYIGEMYTALSMEIKWPLKIKLAGSDLFGENKDVPVIKLDISNELFLAREIVSMFVSDWKIKPQTNFTHFAPHITTEARTLDYILNAYPITRIFFPQLISWESSE